MDKNSPEYPRVSPDPSKWSVTDCHHVCGRCGANLTGCALCIGEPIFIVDTYSKNKFAKKFS